jgi:putative hydrolase of the HAD superfamily
MPKNLFQIKAIAFDWGGTLTPWHDVDLHDRWLTFAKIYSPDRAGELAKSLLDGELSRWSNQFETNGEIGTGAMEAMFHENGIDTSSPQYFTALDAYLTAWEPNTWTDPEALPLLEELKGRGLKLAVLSNTMWPRRFHETVLERDGILHLFDYLLFTSETAAAKPHRSVFADVLYNLDVEASQTAFVGDRLFDDISGAQGIGMRGIWIPHSNIPAEQSTDLGIKPDATIQKLSDIPAILDSWSE